MTEMVYKIFRGHEWEAAKQAGAFAGSADDLKDGFMHFSTARQLRTTFDRYFNSEHNLILVSIDGGALGEALKWEVSRGGEKFPHLYRPLKLAEVRSVYEIRRDADGRPIFPAGIP